MRQQQTGWEQLVFGQRKRLGKARRRLELPAAVQLLGKGPVGSGLGLGKARRRLGRPAAVQLLERGPVGSGLGL